MAVGPGTVVSINGRPVAGKRATISIHDPAVWSGDGLFETILVVGDRLVFGKEHLDRLTAGARLVRLPLPCGRRQMTEWVLATAMRVNGHLKRVRLTVTGAVPSGRGGNGPTGKVIVFAAPHEIPDAPIRLWIGEERLAAGARLPGLKSTSYLFYQQAYERARQHQCHDALLFNRDGKIAEASTANLFIVRKGRIITPPLEAGCLDGVTRRKVLEEARQAGVAAVEEAIGMQALRSAEEVFVTNATRLVTPVTAVRAQEETFEFVPGPVTRRMSSRIQVLAGILH